MSALRVTDPVFVNEAVRQFKEQAAATTSSHELALLEYNLWRQVKSFILGPSRTFKTMRWDVTIGQRNAAYYRSALLSRGDPVKTLWSYIDAKQITTCAALGLAIRSEQERRPMDQLIAEHLVLPVTKSKRGTYRRTPRKQPSESNGSSRVPLSDQKKAVPPAPPPPPLVERAAPLDEWKQLRGAVGIVVDHLLGGLAEPQRTQLRREFKLEVDLLMQTLSNRLYAEKNSPSEKRHHRDVVCACEVLNVQPPRRGYAIDPKTRAEARRNYRKLALHYHPDLRGGDESYRHLLDQVVQAWDIVNNASVNELRKEEDHHVKQSVK